MSQGWNASVPPRGILRQSIESEFQVTSPPRISQRCSTRRSLTSANACQFIAHAVVVAHLLVLLSKLGSLACCAKKRALSAHEKLEAACNRTPVVVMIFCR